VFRLLKEEQDTIKDSWSSGMWLDTSGLMNAKQIGVCEGIDKILFMEVEDE